MGTDLTIRTSEKGWLSGLAIAYRDKKTVLLIDDAEVGIDPTNETIFQMGRRAGLTRKEWMQVLSCLGVSGIGLTLIVIAALDPEPTSKLTLLLAGGTFLAVAGGGSALYVVTGIRPPIIEVCGPGFTMRWGVT